MVKPNGSKLWRLKYKYQGREKTLALGAYPEVGLNAARMKRAEARDQLDRGIDPSQARAAAKKACHTAALAAIETFEYVAVEWLLVRLGTSPTDGATLEAMKKRLDTKLDALEATGPRAPR